MSGIRNFSYASVDFFSVKLLEEESSVFHSIKSTEENTENCENANFFRIEKKPENIDYLSKLPDELLLSIYQYLDFTSLYQCFQTNSKLSNAALDYRLYQNLDITLCSKEIYDLPLEWWLKRCKNVQKIKLGCLGSSKRAFWDNFRLFLQVCCPRLTELAMKSCSFKKAGILVAVQLSKSLTNLSIQNSVFPSKEYSSLGSLTHLITLNLSGSNVTHTGLIQILKSNPNLEKLQINNCYNIINLNKVVPIVIKCNKKLRVWSSSFTVSLTISGLKKFIECPNLEVLNADFSTERRDHDQEIEEFRAGCPNLQKYYIRPCFFKLVTNFYGPFFSFESHIELFIYLRKSLKDLTTFLPAYHSY